MVHPKVELHLIVLFAAILAAPAADSQTVAPAAQRTDSESVAVPQFDVIFVKSDKTASGVTRVRLSPDGLAAENVTVHMLLLESYQLNEDQLVDEPTWVRTDRFDIQAKVAGDAVAALAKLSAKDRRTMFRQVLAEQFQLRTHMESRQLPVYVVTLAKGGPKFRQHVPDPTHPERENGSGWFNNGPGRMVALGSTLDYFLFGLSQGLGRTFVDKTGLTGKYDFTLEWTPDDTSIPSQSEAAAPQHGATDSEPSIFTAIREQLGLKLGSAKGPVQVLVIDHIERPTGN